MNERNRLLRFLSREDVRCSPIAMDWEQGWFLWIGVRGADKVCWSLVQYSPLDSAKLSLLVTPYPVLLFVLDVHSFLIKSSELGA